MEVLSEKTVFATPMVKNVRTENSVDRKYERYIFQFLRIVCIGIAIWMSIDQIIRYFENDDHAMVTYKKFHDSARDQYPTYTLCFQIKKRPISRFNPTNFFNETYLQQKFNITKLDYLSILWNDISHGKSNKDLKKLSNNTNLSKIDFENAAKHPKEVISDYLVGYNTGIHTKLPRRDMKTLMIMSNQSWVNPAELELFKTMLRKRIKKIQSKDGFSKTFPFYKSYQDDERICMTRRNEYKHMVTHDFEHITYWTWKKDYFDQIVLFMHHPGHGMRQFFQKFQSKALTERNTQKLTENDFNVMKFSINHVSVLRKRSDGNQPCEPYQDDDEQMYETIFQIIPCVPPYWKIFQPKHSQK